jgi:predicted nuclease of predicted toxin-antitoxin system
LLTFDLDFADILAAGAHTLPSVIIFRLRNQTPSSVTPKLLEVLSKRSNELAAGAIIIVEDARYRLRRLPIEPSKEK